MLSVQAREFDPVKLMPALSPLERKVKLSESAAAPSVGAAASLTANKCSSVVAGQLQ